MNSPWSLKTFQTRIRNLSQRERFEAGSPNSQEVEAYADQISKHFQGNCAGKNALVLGMTPELRVMLHSMGMVVTCIDNNKNAIALFRDWVPDEFLEREQIIECDWINLPNCLDQPVDVVVGDGIFGNLITFEAHTDLLNKLLTLIKPNGVCIFRKKLTPNNFDLKHYTATSLIERYRSNELDETEFGFAMRIFGLRDIAFDEANYLLDNQQSFIRFKKLYQENRLTHNELEAINRYYFGGLNLITPQQIWEEILEKAGFKFQISKLTGKDWYNYYCIYRCWHH